MREIKFRVWDKESKNMYYEISVFTEKYADMLNMSIKYSQKKYGYVFMQYTGLKDQDGVEIYEGDIVRIIDEVNNKDWKSKVFFKEGCFMVYDENGNYQCLSAYASEKEHQGSHFCLVLGNVFEDSVLSF
jgi:uncharacterized phage protein (TIGR01671 family)